MHADESRPWQDPCRKVATSIIERLTPHAKVRNASPAELVERTLVLGTGKLTNTGALSVFTGSRTGRSPNDRFIVKNPGTEKEIAWGKINIPIEPEKAAKVRELIIQHLSNSPGLIQVDAWIGADARFGRPVKVFTDSPWHALFSWNIFRRVRLDEQGNLLDSDGTVLPKRPPLVILAAPYLTIDPATSGLKSEVGIILDLDEGVITVHGSQYGGEIKKSAFTAMNFYLPFEGVFPMHCSANVGQDGKVALFFGLSGTGKTTLSADSSRPLIGDDEHGWSQDGVFNFEGGCYAKCINLSKEHEPEIWNAIRFGALVENVVVDPVTRIPDYTDDSVTENTRATYPLFHNSVMLESGKAGHPSTVFFLVADAFGVMPPIAELTPEQAMYYFVSGYTAKLAGTEAGMGNAVQATFSSCFGEPFLPLHPQRYADMLKEKIQEHGTKCYLLNTGWSGGPYGVGKRLRLPWTRAMVNAALSGELAKVETYVDPVFGLKVPLSCPNVPSEVMIPENTWQDKEEYRRKRLELAAKFKANIERFGMSKEVLEAGPRV